MKGGPIFDFLRTLILSLVAACLGSVGAFAQAPGALAGVTPHQVQDGSAALIGHTDPSKRVRVVIGLEHPNLAQEKQFLRDLGNKNSPNFQHFLTAAQWNARFAPSAAAEQSVVDWANAAGLTVSHRYSNRLLVDVDASVANIEAALGVTINDYKVGTRMAYSNDRAPVLPPSVASVIHSVAGLNTINVLRPMANNRKEPSFADYVAGPVVAKAASGGGSAKAKRPTGHSGVKSNLTNGFYDPTDIYNAQAYDVDALNNLGHCCNPLGNAGSTPPSSSIAIATAGTQNASDFAGFQAQYPYLAYHYVTWYIDGTPACCDDEGTLDFEWSTAMSNSFGSLADTSLVYMYDAVNSNISTFTDVYNQILSDGSARIFSTSWGCEEVSCWDTSDVDTADGIFDAMVGQGWTLFAATGDQGATAGCGNAIAVQFPGSDPNIVGAGGATLQAAGYFSSEVAWTGGTFTGACGANDGGSTGGVSRIFGPPSFQASLGYANRTVPDIALNASIGQNYYFNGALSNTGGTSIVAPELAGLFAQTAAYLDFVATQNGGCYGTSACTPMGNGNYYLYYLAENQYYAAHYPFYDITQGCNSNDLTALYSLGSYCAGTGYDLVTGWGSLNALQLAWGVITYRAGDFSPPTAALSSSATPGVWYNADQYVQWSLTDTGSGLPAVGVSGYTATWDTIPVDSNSVARPATSDGFFTGPVTPNATYGYEYVSDAGQGCHYAYVDGYDNSGSNSVSYYGPVCYDTVPPVVSPSLAGTLSGTVYTSKVTVTLAATDASSGVAATYYSLDGAAFKKYSAPFAASAYGAHTVKYYATDVAGNTATTQSVNFAIKYATKISVKTSLNPAQYKQPLTFTATVSTAQGGALTGKVAFTNGGTVLGSATIGTGNVAVFNVVTPLPAGRNTITATYQGAALEAPASQTFTELIDPDVTKTTLTSSPNPSTLGQAVTLTANVTSAYASVGGTVTFTRGSNVIGTANVSSTTHNATLVTKTLPVGTDTIVAIFPAGTDFGASTSNPVAQKVNQ